MAPSQNIFVPLEHLGAGVNGEEGTNQESVSALLVTAGGGASCASGGGELHVMAVIFVFFCGSAPFFEIDGGKNKEESKIVIKP